MTLTIIVTRYFTCDDCEAEQSLTFSGSKDKVLENATNFVENGDVPDFPDMGNPWREMTDEEAADYIKRKDEEEKENRRRHSFYDEDEE